MKSRRRENMSKELRIARFAVGLIEWELTKAMWIGTVGACVTPEKGEWSVHAVGLLLCNLLPIVDNQTLPKYRGSC